MSRDRSHRLHELLNSSLELAPDQRREFLQKACADDTSLIAEIESLLAAHERAGNFLSDSPHSIKSAGQAASVPAGLRIGRYQIQRVIATGGMGVVYEALQEHPRRTVALKLMKTGFASPATRRRFEYESQILGRLSHPGIAQVFEAGTQDNSTTPGTSISFIAMEFISGARTITEFVAQQKLSIPVRLELFLRVCDAVAHAHQRGIIHRDLKPGNVLVDASGQPKIIDFGVARAVDEVDAGIQTGTGQLLGTVRYMSPEQCQTGASREGIDIRSDVYALGLLLYELLTSQFPYEIRGESSLDAIRIIREVRPTRPSSTTSGLRGDLETIMLKALEKERERRYQSAHDLARDIRHYLAGEPIDAKRDSGWYVVTKTIRRYRLAAALVATLTTVVIASSIILAVLLKAQVRERLRADQEADTSRKQVAIAASVNNLLNEVLTRADRGEQRGNTNVTVRESLDDFTHELDAHPAKYAPEVEASVRTTIGNTYRALGAYDVAEPQLRRAVEITRRLKNPDFGAVAARLTVLGKLLCARGNYPEAEKCLRDSILVCRGLKDQPLLLSDALTELGVLLGRNIKYVEAESSLRQALEIRERIQGEHRDVASVMNNLGVLMESKGDSKDAESIYRSAVAMYRKTVGNEHPETATALNNLGLLLKRKGDISGAEPYYREALEMRTKLLGEDHPDVGESLNNLAALLRFRRDYAGAIPLYRKALAIFRKTLGNEHPNVLTVSNNLAMALGTEGDGRGAQVLFEEILAVRRKILGPAHPEVALTLMNIAGLQQGRGELDAAESTIKEALEIDVKALGEDHPGVGSTRYGLASVLRDKGEYAAAETHARRALEIARKRREPNHPEVILYLNGVAQLRELQNDYEQASSLYREALALSHQPGPGADLLTFTLSNLGVVVQKSGDAAGAETLLREALAKQREYKNPDQVAMSGTLINLGDALMTQDKVGEAEHFYREALAIREKTLTKERWRIGMAQCALGECLAKGKRYAESEPLLLAGYQAIKDAPRVPKGRAREILKHITQLYADWKRPGQEAEWRAKWNDN